MVDKSEAARILYEKYKDEFDDDTEKFLDAVDDISDPISFTLRTHLFVENQIDKFIENFLPKGNLLLNYSFNQKLQIVKAFGIINLQLLDAISKLNSVRNDIAHEIDYEISKNTIIKIGRPLGKEFSEFKKEHFPLDPDSTAKVLESLLSLLAGTFSSKVNYYIIGNKINYNSSFNHSKDT